MSERVLGSVGHLSWWGLRACYELNWVACVSVAVCASDLVCRAVRGGVPHPVGGAFCVLRVLSAYVIVLRRVVHWGPLGYQCNALLEVALYPLWICVDPRDWESTDGLELLVSAVIDLT